MSILEIIAGVLLIFCSVVIVALVVAQQPQSGMGGALGGSNDMYSSMQSRSIDSRIANVTKYAGIAFFVIAIAVSVVEMFAK